MILTRLSVNRPIATLMFYLALCLLGLISWTKLPQDLFPPVSYPQVTVMTAYSNAAPEEVQNLITKPIEESISTVANLKRIQSVSREGLSLVTAEFGWKTKMDFAALAIRQKIDLIKERLPRECKEPIVKKLNPFELPILVLSLRGQLAEDKLLTYGKKVIKKALSKVEGVASVSVYGGKDPEIFVDVDLGLLRARNLDITKIGKALQESNLNYPAGTTKETYFEYLIRTEGEFETVDDIGKTILNVEKFKTREDDPDANPNEFGVVTLNDVAEISQGFAETSSISRYNGVENILISVYKQSDANTLETAKKLKYKIESMVLLQNVQIDTVYDKSLFIENAIQGVKSAGIQGGFLALLVLLVFLQSVSASLIVFVSIPISILVAFVLMYFFGISVNMMSLGGLAFGIGQLVDASIVVIENIVRKQNEKGTKNIKTIAVEATEQVWGGIFASTLTNIAVFLPMIFLTGVEGQLFKQLALTITFSLLASLLVALSLIPRLSFNNRYLSSRGWLSDFFGPYVDRLQKQYEILLLHFLERQKKYFTILFFVFVAALLVFLNLPRELIPKTDEGQFGLKLTMPAGTTLKVTDMEVRKIEKILLEEKPFSDAIKNVSVSIGSKPEDALEGGQPLGSHQAQITVVLNPDYTLTKSQALSTETFVHRLYARLEKTLSPKAALESKMTSEGLMGALSSKAPIQVQVLCEDLENLRKQAGRVHALLVGIPGIINLKTTLSEPSPETKIKIDKNRMAIFGLSSEDIALGAQTAIKGSVTTEFKNKEGEQVPIRVRLAEKDRNDLAQIENIPIWTDKVHSVYLQDVAEFKQGLGPSEILRVNQSSLVEISADVLDVPIDQMRHRILEELKIFRDFSDTRVLLVEETEEEKSAFRGSIFTLILSVLLVYMIMAAQFESLLHPFLIMVTVPLGIIGVSFGLLVTGKSLSVVALLGVIMLGGIVVNNGIMLIEYIRQMRDQGKPIRDAVIEACRHRFRPILMTTLTNILGLLPLALGLGQGGGLQSPMAIAVVFGMSVSTFFTLLVLPALCLMLDRKT